MLADTDRLGQLINNLLSAQRIEQKETKLNLRPGDLSDLVAGYFRPRQFSLPQAGKMELAVEPGLRARIDAEALEMVLRNLLENALLYATGAPQLTVTLRRQGRQAHLLFADRGRGLEKKELKKVFRMFYRVRQPGETIRGSGLGLFIAQAVVRGHGGKIRVESAGLGEGTSFHILLPLLPEESGR